MLKLIYNENTKEAQRLFHGRGKSFPGLEFFNIDYFPPVILITLYQELSSEMQTFIIEKCLANKTLEVHSILLQKRYLALAPTEVIYGEDIDDLIIVENLIKYHIQLRQSQNIGFFLDMRLGREMLRKYASKKRVLNLFSYTCAFSVVALKHGALEVVNVDMSKRALDRGKKNHTINEINLQFVKFFSYDIFKSFALLKRQSPFDWIIIDPPTDQGSHFKVDRDYPKLLRRIVDWTIPGAYIMTCLNSPFHTFSFLEACVQKNAPDLILIEKCGAPESFVEIYPDKGLKIILWRKP